MQYPKSSRTDVSNCLYIGRSAAGGVSYNSVAQCKVKMMEIALTRVVVVV